MPRRTTLSRNGLLRVALHEAVVFIAGPAVVSDCPPDLLEQAWRACEAAVEDGTAPEQIRRYVEGGTPCHRCWAWWTWTQGEEPLYGVEAVLRLLELGELREEEIDAAIALADESLDKIGRDVWHGVGSRVREAEALIAATGRVRLRPYRSHEWDQATETSEWVTVQ